MYVRGMYAAPAGSIVGTYRSMLPKSFLGTRPCDARELCRPTATREVRRKTGTHIDDRVGDVELGLPLRVEALHDVLLAREPRAALACEGEVVVVVRHRHLDRAFLVHGDGVLLHPLHWLAAFAHSAPLAHPVLGRLECDDGCARVYWLSAELA